MQGIYCGQLQKHEKICLQMTEYGSVTDYSNKLLGSTMFSKYGNESEEATDALDYVQDERVIPYFVRASETNRFGLKFSALHALSKFDNESAFVALQKMRQDESESVSAEAERYLKLHFKQDSVSEH